MNESAKQNPDWNGCLDLCLCVRDCPRTRHGNPESWPHDKWPPLFCPPTPCGINHWEKQTVLNRQKKKKRRRRTEQRERRGKTSCKQHNVNESLAEAQSCSERVFRTPPHTHAHTHTQPLPDKLKAFGGVMHGGDREQRKRGEQKEQGGKQGRRWRRARGHGKD